MSELVRLDGSEGEGGGQVVRSCLALSAVTGKPFILENVRAKRNPPGLKRQHVTAVRAAAEICAAQVKGAELGSNRLEFHPGPTQAGNYSFAIDTAGSATLVLQTVLPALMMADGVSQVTVRGGTHNPLAPTFDFLQSVYFPILQRMGIGVTGRIDRYGFFPVGGGEIRMSVKRTGVLRGIVLSERGQWLSTRVEAVLARLPEHIGQREIDTVLQARPWHDLETIIRAVDALCPGNALSIEMRFEHITELTASLGRRGLPAEKVAADCAAQAQAYLDANVPVGHHLADQLLLPMAIVAHACGQPSEYVTGPLSEHSLTHINVIHAFLGDLVAYEIAGHGVRVRVQPLQQGNPR
jgi:RNA 3'-terminal phosphate cyclase (ATP)